MNRTAVWIGLLASVAGPLLVFWRRRNRTVERTHCECGLPENHASDCYDNDYDDNYDD